MKQIARSIVLFYLLFLAACNTTYQQQHSEARQYAIRASDTLSNANSFSERISPYRDSMNLVMNEQVAYAAAPLVKGQPESPLGNFVADACHSVVTQYCNSRQVQPPDFTMLNNGGLRSALPAGKISKGNIYELMPFENELVILTLNDSSFNALMLYIARRKGNPVSHLQMKITDSTATAVFVDGKPQSEKHTFRLLTSDYLSHGGDNLEFLKDIPAEATGIKVRDAIFEYLQEHKQDTLKAETDGRIQR